MLRVQDRLPVGIGGAATDEQQRFSGLDVQCRARWRCRRPRRRSSGAPSRARRRGGEQVVERARARRRPRETRRRVRPRTHTIDQREGLVVGEVDALDPQHLGVHVERQCGRDRAGAATNPKARIRRAACAPAASTAASIVVTRPSGWRTGSSAANQPAPWRLTTSPSRRSRSRARRTVTRLVLWALASSASLGSAPPGPNRPSATRARRVSAKSR